MQTLPVTPISWFLAFSPIAVVLVLMIGFRWGGSRAGPVGWIVAMLVAWLYFEAGPAVLAYSQVRGLLLTVYVLYIIWMALLLFSAEKMPQKEVARLLGLSVDGVKWHVFTARKKLKDELKDYL